MLLPTISLAAMTGRLRHFRRDRRGSAAVEFALVAPMFFALIFAILETGMVFYADQLLETGVQDGARLYYTSQPIPVETLRSTICNRVSMMMDCSKFDTDVRSYDPGTTITITDPIDASGNYIPGNFVYQPPSTYPTSKTVVVRAFYQWPLFVTQLGYNIANIGRGTSSSKRLLAATMATGPQ